MENRKTLTEQIERLLALADERQLRRLYIAALQLGEGGGDVMCRADRPVSCNSLTLRGVCGLK